MNRIEDRLRDAFGTAAGTVRPESVAGLADLTRAPRARRLAPLAAAAAVAVVVGASVITPLALTGGHQALPPSTGTGGPATSMSPGRSGATSPPRSGSGEPTRLLDASAYAVTIAIPRTWQPTANLGPVAGYAGADGWVQVTAVTEPGGLRAACSAVASQPAYGSQPRISYRSIGGQPGCLIVPSGDAPVASQPTGGPGLPRTTALTQYRRPLSSGANFLLISADPAHIVAIVDSVQLHS